MGSERDALMFVVLELCSIDFAVERADRRGGRWSTVVVANPCWRPTTFADNAPAIDAAEAAVPGRRRPGPADECTEEEWDSSELASPGVLGRGRDGADKGRGRAHSVSS